MNTFHGLLIEESNDIRIESENELRKCCKKLRQKSIKFARLGGEDLQKEIQKLIIEIQEYKNCSVQPKKKKEKERKGILHDDDYFMNQVIKEKKMIQIRKEVKEKRTNNLWKGTLKYNDTHRRPEWSLQNPSHTVYKTHTEGLPGRCPKCTLPGCTRPDHQQPEPWKMIVKIPKWSPGTHTLFPDNHKRTIIQLLCYANREGTLLSLLPQEVFFQIIEDMEWSDFPDKDMKKNKITIYNVKGGECFDVMWGEGAKVIKKEKVNQMKQEK